MLHLTIDTILAKSALFLIHKKIIYYSKSSNFSTTAQNSNVKIKNCNTAKPPGVLLLIYLLANLTIRQQFNHSFLIILKLLVLINVPLLEYFEFYVVHVLGKSPNYMYI